MIITLHNLANSGDDEGADGDIKASSVIYLPKVSEWRLLIVRKPDSKERTKPVAPIPLLSLAVHASSLLTYMKYIPLEDNSILYLLQLLFPLRKFKRVQIQFNSHSIHLICPKEETKFLMYYKMQIKYLPQDSIAPEREYSSLVQRQGLI